MLQPLKFITFPITTLIFICTVYHHHQSQKEPWISRTRCKSRKKIVSIPKLLSLQEFTNRFESEGGVVLIEVVREYPSRVCRLQIKRGKREEKEEEKRKRETEENEKKKKGKGVGGRWSLVFWKATLPWTQPINPPP